MLGALIRTDGLGRRFGHRTALADVTITVGGGQIRLVVGPNGAGKTTLLRTLATLTRPTSGTASVAGFDIRDDPEAVRERIGVLLHEALLYPELTATENLRFYASLYGVREKADVRGALRLVGLLPRADDQVGTFSMGMRRRLTFARATLHRPDVLLLDEPLAGLDREGIRVVTRFLEGLRDEGRTILLTTHSVERDWALGDSVTVLHRGRVVLEREVAADGLQAFVDDLEVEVAGDRRWARH